MTTPRAPLTPDPAYFERLYDQADDPWGLTDRFYEQRKRNLLLACLPRARFVRGFEPGCATGVLTAGLAQRCAELVAWDVVDRAVELTRARQLPRVLVERMAFPAESPTGRFDLIVISEVGYYCPELDKLASAVDELIEPGGSLVACHWRHPAADHPHDAETVHAVLGRDRHLISHHVEEDFLLDVWCDTDTSVARAEGIIGPRHCRG